MNPDEQTTKPLFQGETTESALVSESEDQGINPNDAGRRSFLGALLGVGTFGVAASLFVPLIRFALHPAFIQTTETAWSNVGPLTDFAELITPVKRIITVEQRDGWRKVVTEKSVYVTKGADGKLHVLASVCPHLGCAVGWNETKGRFICPCHNGIFASDGVRISGPPPRNLDELETKVEEGHVKVRYQYFRQLVPTKEVIA